MRDLEWLARNVHKWSNDDLSINRCGSTDDTYSFPTKYAPKGSYTKDQWLAERARLQNKPEIWKGDWLAQDSTGYWYSYEDEPVTGPLGWEGGSIDFYSKGEVLGDWRNTLESKDKQEYIIDELGAINDVISHDYVDKCNGNITDLEWLDIGVPRVGTICEAAQGEEWYRVEVLDYDNTSGLWYLLFVKESEVAGEVRVFKNIQFRKIKTEEELAIESITKVFNRSFLKTPFSPATEIYKAIKSGEIKVEVAK